MGGWLSLDDVSRMSLDWHPYKAAGIPGLPYNDMFIMKERKKEFYLSSSRDIHLYNSYTSEQTYIEHCRMSVYCDLAVVWYYTTYTKEGR